MRGKSSKNKKKLLIAVAIGILPTIGIFNMMNSQKAEMARLQQQLAEEKKKPATKTPQKAIEKPVEKSNAVLAKVDINKGELITIDKIVKKEYSKEELPESFFNNETYVLGKTASDFILQGKIITNDDILAKELNFVVIPDGMRAITIPTASIQGLAPYITTGSRIDIYTAKSPSELIAQNIEIVSLESTPQQTNRPVSPGETRNKNISADQSSSITILVPVELADNVIDSMMQGRLQVVTRGKTDSKIIRKVEDIPPPPITDKLPDIPAPIEEPKVAVEIYTGHSFKKTCYDENGIRVEGEDCSKHISQDDFSSSASSSKIDSKTLNDLLKLAK